MITPLAPDRARDAAAAAGAVTDFAALEPGHVYGTHVLPLDAALVDAWCAVYGAQRPDERVPAGMLSVISIRAFMALIPVRPPGGVHAAQAFELHDLPRVGERVSTTLRCGHKEARGGRHWVRLEMECVGEDARPLFSGVHTALWAR